MSDTVSEQEVVEQVQEVVQENTQEAPVSDTEVLDNTEGQEEAREQNVPLAALQKERRKRQDAEQRNLEKDQELRMFREHQLKQMQEAKPQEEDESQYEPITKAEQAKREEALIRNIEEKSWIRQNPEKAEVINEKLANFLTKRPNLAAAIEASSNRYEEAWDLMDKLTPKQKAALASPQTIKREAPNSPSGVPKAAAINQAVGVMSMSDSEYVEWRNSKRSRR